jgi:dienelactone hydrolase
MSTKLFLSIAISFLLVASVQAQPTKADYQRADSTAKFNDLVLQSVTSVNWIDSTTTYWYTVRTSKGIEYKWGDAAKNQVKPAFDPEKLCAAINAQSKGEHKPYALPLKELKFIEGSQKITFELDDFHWTCDLKKYKLEKGSKVEKPNSERYWAAWDDENTDRVSESPDRKYEAFVRESNVFLREKESKTLTQLSFDGSPGDYYSDNIEWSPDSKKLAVNKIRKHEKRFIHFMESSPKNQVQPVLQKREYLKPGDALPIKRPCLFHVETKTQIAIDATAYELQYDLSNLKWWPGSEAFTFEFNQRGHQLYQVVEVNATTGKTTPIIEECFETFVEYSGKHFRHDVDETKEIVWMSERDGWNHLYLIDGSTGKVKNQITKGEWVVREVVKVDAKTRTILFKGSGKNPGEDPYFVHYYKVNFDGSNLVDLTPERKEHSATFSADFTYFIDTYSTVTEAPVTVLRSAADGKVLSTLETADITQLLAKNWKQPEVFVAKARDGQTDIWGNIYFPTNFDPTKKYPVIEYIYAGPQSSFAQKSFRPYSPAFTGLCELGFIVVQMDGMGTSNRSKAFHDVCFQNIKDAGFIDRILWTKAAAATRPYMDISKVGIFGGSAGGQNSTSAVLFHPEFYKVAVSSCGCHDNRMDKMWWNEQWMGYPIGKHYEESSNVMNAAKLEGNLMLIVGEVDDNVDPASTMQVADALIKAKKDFELVVLPGVGHTLGGEYGERKRRDFFVKHLYGSTTPVWNR